MGTDMIKSVCFKKVPGCCVENELEGEQIGENLLNNIQVSQLIIYRYHILYCNLLGFYNYLVSPCGN